MSNLFFKVQQTSIKDSVHFNPVPRKIIDVQEFHGDQLVYSSVASEYLYQEKHNLLVDDKKRQKQSYLKYERGVLNFPAPRLPSQLIKQIEIQEIQDAYMEYFERIPSQFRPHLTEQTEDF